MYLTVNALGVPHKPLCKDSQIVSRPLANLEEEFFFNLKKSFTCCYRYNLLAERMRMKIKKIKKRQVVFRPQDQK